MIEKVHPRSWFFLVLSLLCQGGAGVLGKTAALRMGIPSPAAFILNPWYIGSLLCLVLQAFCWQIVLREVRLFVAYLVTSLNYFLVLAASRLIFREHVSAFHFAGAGVIVVGVYLVVREDLS